MRSATNKSLLAATLVFGLLILTIPRASSADLPLLTWERGKEQNVVLGGSAVPKKWRLELRDGVRKVLDFKRSEPNSQGFVVYSTFVPVNFPEGEYFIEVVEESGKVNSIMAGVNIVPMQVYSITQVPKDLKFVNLILCFLITLLSLSRSHKYRNLSYLRPEFPKLENDYLEQMATKKLSLKRSFFDSRIHKLDAPIENLMRFMMTRNEAFVFKLSPRLFRHLPIVAIALGALGGILSAGTFPNLPYLVFLVLLMLSALDFYSAMLASTSFVAVQIILGNITSVKSILAILFSLTGLLFSVLIGELLQVLALKDFDHVKSVMSRRVIFNLINLASALLSSLFFYGSALITKSLSNNSLSQYQAFLVMSAMVFMTSLSKLYLQEYLDNWYSAKNDQVEIISAEIKRVATPTSAFVFFVIAFLVTYAWSERLNTALIAGITFTIPYLFTVTRIGLKSKFCTTKRFSGARSALLEPLLIVALSYGIYALVSLRPMAIIQKSEILLAVGFIFVTLHAILGSLYAKNPVKSQEVKP